MITQLKQMLRKKLTPAIALAGLSALILALCLNGPRPTCSLVKAVEITAQMNADVNDQDSEGDSTQPSQNTSNTYEEIHDEIVILPNWVSRPFFSFFIPPATQALNGLTLSKLPRPPRSV